jgi:hypothetical protein
MILVKGGTAFLSSIKKAMVSGIKDWAAASATLNRYRGKGRQKVTEAPREGGEVRYSWWRSGEPSRPRDMAIPSSAS